MRVDEEKIKRLNILRVRRVIFVVILFAIVLLAFNNIIKSIAPNKTENDINFMYHISNDIDYKVHMYDNSFFTEKYLGKGKQYTSDLIKNIEIDFKSSFSNSKLSNLTYSYEIIGNLVAYNRNNPESGALWEKEYNLKDLITRSDSNVSSKTIKENLNVDFAYYNAEANNFKKELNVDIDAYLNIDMKIKYKFETEGQLIDKEKVDLKLSIPLAKTTFEIEEVIPKDINETKLIEVSEKIDYVKLTIGIVILIIALIMTIWFVKEILRISKKTEYQKRLNKILRNYGDIIAETANLPDYSKLEILEIQDFKDLADIEYETRIPILYFERKADKEGWFIIIKDKHMYRYMLFADIKTDRQKH